MKINRSIQIVFFIFSGKKKDELEIFIKILFLNIYILFYHLCTIKNIAVLYYRQVHRANWICYTAYTASREVNIFIDENIIFIDENNNNVH